MELTLNRSYFPDGCNGEMYCNGQRLCYTIELPWKANRAATSCIPEGRYLLKKRYSPKFKWHLLVAGVPGRSLVLLHAANDALKELKGCIAPVTTLTGEGKGDLSKKALELVKTIVYTALSTEPVYLTIQSNYHDID